MTEYRIEVFRMLLSFACGVMSIKHLLDVCSYAKQEDLIKTIYHGIWAVTMLMLCKL